MTSASPVGPVLPYGSWPSPISATSLVDGVTAPNGLVVDGTDVWWSEARPSEGGRTAIMRRRGNSDGEAEEITPPDANVRSRVHEYGGGAWWAEDGVLVYSEFADQRLRRLDPGGTPLVLTPEPDRPGALRYADGRLSADGHWFVCVREAHGAEGEPTNEIVAVATDGSEEVLVLVSGADFYASPRLSADGTLLAWVQWHHPNMPWDASELWIGELRPGGIEVVAGRPVAGGPAESVGQPEWHADGSLYFTSDRSGWSNLYRRDAGGDVELEVGGEFEIGWPHWVFGGSRYALDADGGVVAALRRPRGDVLFDTTNDRTDHGWATISTVRTDADGRPVLLAASHDQLVAVVRPGDPPELVSVPHVHGVAPGYLPPPELIDFPTTDDETAHALFYRPAHPSLAGPEDERPPLLVLAHGGPSSQARRELQLGLRYWTSRGWAVVDVDYRGSTGYGRSYLRALEGRWGLADVDDCIAVARHLAQRGDVDPERLAIRGGSAGGFTVISALTFHDVFTAGASRYGIADLEVLATDTHKFESRYLEGLVGPYPTDRATYVARSPIHHTERLSAPMIVLQGADDEVVPPNQAEMMVEALAAKGVEHRYVLFEGEGHGFRRSENIVAALEAEEAFFAHVFGFTPP